MATLICETHSDICGRIQTELADHTKNTLAEMQEVASQANLSELRASYSAIEALEHDDNWSLDIPEIRFLPSGREDFEAKVGFCGSSSEGDEIRSVEVPLSVLLAACDSSPDAVLRLDLSGDILPEDEA